MVKPRMIILIRHAQSEGNKNRDIHQYVPDHRVKLTPDGWRQAEEAGRRLRSMLRPDDTLQFYTSPYRRARETTEGILKTLTNEDAEQGPSPFPRHKVKVYEEPRLREQDFGNFQPCSAEMERMWQERADYGHFFYRIPNGESAADAYDRCSGFNESLWRQFSDTDFPSVCVLVTHGLMTRIFLMKWYHWSVEYFEDLRNINHCEFIVMMENPDNGRYVLQNELRTWSDLKKHAAAAQGNGNPSIKRPESVLYTPGRRWGGCASGCDHAKLNYPRKPRRQNTADFLSAAALQGQARPNEKEDHPIAAKEEEKGSGTKTNGNSSPVATRKKSMSSSKSADSGATPSAGADTTSVARTEPLTSDEVLNRGPDPDEAADGDDVTPSESSVSDGDKTNETGDLEGATTVSHEHQHPIPNPLSRPNQLPILPTNPLVMGRDFGGSRSGFASPASGSDDDSDYFDTNVHQLHARLSVAVPGGSAHPPRSDLSRSLLAQISDDDGPTGSASPKTQLVRSGSRKSLKERPRATGATKRERTNSRGSGSNGKRKGSVASKTEQEWLEESGMMSGKKADALGDVEEGDGDGELSPPTSRGNENGTGKVTDAVVEGLKMRDRKGFGEIY